MADSGSFTYTGFPRELVRVIPEFQPLYNEHVAYYDEVLPHVLMGSFTRFFKDALERSWVQNPNGLKWRGVVTRSLDLLESALASPDDKLQNLIAVSFVENLLPEITDADSYEQLKSLLPGRLREEL